MTRLAAAQTVIAECKQQLRDAAIAYIAEAATCQTTDGDAMAELESSALAFSIAAVELHKSENEAEYAYIRALDGAAAAEG